MDFTDRLIARELADSLGKSVIGRRIIVLKSTRSTNDFLRQMLTPELPAGLVVFAEEQTAGRGQRGHRWASAPHLGLWFSVLLRPRLPPTQSARLTQWAALAISATVRDQFQLASAIKPPNDIYFSGRKLAGILVETKAGKGKEWAAIVGIGVNVNQLANDFPVELQEEAVSLAMALGRRINRVAFARALLRQLDRTWDEISFAPCR